MCRAAFVVLACVAWGCRAPATAVATPEAAPAPERPAPTPNPTRPDDAQCREHGPVHQVKVTDGETTTLRPGLAVTYAGSTLDHYDDGTADQIMQLSFNGERRSGEPLPSEVGWMPSAFAAPSMHYLPTGDCVRVVEVGAAHVLLDVAEPMPAR